MPSNIVSFSSILARKPSDPPMFTRIFIVFSFNSFSFFLVRQKYLGLILMSILHSTTMKFLIEGTVAFGCSMLRVHNESGKSVNCSASSGACSTFSYSAQRNEN